MIPVSRQAIDAGPDQKMGANLLRRAEELIDIALTVSDVDAARRIAQDCTGLLEVLQPADALLLLDGNPRQVDSVLERRCSLEFLAGPELDRGQSKWKTFAGHCKTGMHQDAANGVRPKTSSLVPSAVNIIGHADRFGAFSLKR